MVGMGSGTVLALLGAGRILAKNSMTTGDKIWFVMLLVGGILVLAALAAAMYGFAKHNVEMKVKKELRNWARHLSEEDERYRERGIGIEPNSLERYLCDLEKRTGLDLHGD